MSFQTFISNDEEQFVVTLKDVTNNTYAEIFAFGALLNKFCAVNNEETINVIDGFSNPAEAIELMLRSFKSAKLSPFACRTKNAKYKFGEKNYKLSKYTAQKDALHGLLYDAIFSIKTCEAGNTSAFVVLEYIYDNKEEGFPFCYKCEIEYKLAAGNTLEIITSITNMDTKLMPVADGWHPYFTLGGNINDYQLEFQSKEILEFENLIPTGKLSPFQEYGLAKKLGTTVFDNCFTLNFARGQPLCIIRNAAKKVQIEISPSSSYPYLQIYTPAERNSIAIENLSAAPDAFNNSIGLKVLEAGEQAVFSTIFRIKAYFLC